MRLFLAAGLLVLMLNGCGQGENWRTKDIEGVMPRLEFTLSGEDGQTVTQDAFADKVNLLYFGYTHCPDVCPITLAKLRGVISSLPAEVADRIDVLFVSVDPKRDTPDVLRNYTDAFGARFIGLTGSKQQLDEVTRRYRTTYGYGKPDDRGNYEVSHSSAVYAFDPEGRARLLIRNDDRPEDIAHDLKQLAGD
ncbi:MAG: SCO family protein [Lysobacterales bacterium]|jgi:protein SCO1/2